MTKAEARAVLALSRRVDAALEAFERKLDRAGIRRDWYDSYAVGHMYSIIRGQSYGSLPIERAEAALDE